MFHWDLLIPLAGMASGVILILPIIRAGTRYLERLSGGSQGGHELDVLREELDAVRERLEAVESGDGRLAELEERLDFAERMLARRDLPKLGRTD